jgi:hypothetical protein
VIRLHALQPMMQAKERATLCADEDVAVTAVSSLRNVNPDVRL